MSDDRQGPPSADDADDRTRPLPRSGDGTRPPPGSPRGLPAEEPADETRPLPRSGDTGRQPPAGPAVWSGRAGVPPPRPADYRDPAGEDWYAEDQPGRRWWTPILLGVLALLLAGLLGAGLWLLASTDDSPGPGDTSSARPTTAPATTGAPTTEATTAGPSTTPPSTTPPSTTRPAVPMPPLVGLSRATAELVLDQLGIEHRVEARESDQPAGTVLETDPGAGELVPAGEEVTLVVAAAPTPASSAAEPSATRASSPTP
ncbi:PASTA domain protein [Micromonospora sp. MW-13]|uniref:PASTA domain-containing protein n=1 Tax=Micromonospora sp. MW-13 TaxID=2094022 RepID=UPI000E435BB7|nr:PASTA domain-containing protein [Micromonospora sp. MW-13]RGC68888.1 PASTA domain protein [Micromonospora sp. MW-13]